MAGLGYPVTPSTLRVVRAVEKMELTGPFIGDVGERLAIVASTATRHVDQAVKDSYLEKVPDRNDQRRVALKLTKKSRSY